MSPSADTPSAGLRARIDRFQDWWGALPANARGSVWMILSSLTFAVMATGIKLLGQDLPVVEILFFRQMFVLLLVSPAIARGFPSVLKTRRWPVHLTRSLLAFVAMTAGFTALVHLPLAEATAISFARTLFTTILAIVFLHEVVGWRRWSATLVGFLGVVIVARPSPGHLSEYALLALLSAAFVAALQIALRSLARTERPLTIMTYQNVSLSILLVGPTIYLWVTPTLEQLCFLAGIGAFMSVVQWTMIKAYGVGDASAIAPMEYGRLLFAAIAGVLVFSEYPTIHTWIGAALIIGSTLYTLRRNARRQATAEPAAEPKLPGS
ncbi:MAG TPA: DMT family transporter [Thalassobaculum sp.]